jgi:hypothetical protein
MSTDRERTAWEADGPEPGEESGTSDPDALDDDASAPIWRELSAADAEGIFPGVPLS